MKRLGFFLLLTLLAACSHSQTETMQRETHLGIDPIVSDVVGGSVLD